MVARAFSAERMPDACFHRDAWLWRERALDLCLQSLRRHESFLDSSWASLLPLKLLGPFRTRSWVWGMEVENLGAWRWIVKVHIEPERLRLRLPTCRAVFLEVVWSKHPFCRRSLGHVPIHGQILKATRWLFFGPKTCCRCLALMHWLKTQDTSYIVSREWDSVKRSLLPCRLIRCTLKAQLSKSARASCSSLAGAMQRYSSSREVVSRRPVCDIKDKS